MNKLDLARNVKNSSHCEERSDEAISISLVLTNKIAALRSQWPPLACMIRLRMHGAL
jgi:hypothetical protein